MVYCISVWGRISKAKMESIFSLQKKCLRILYGDLEGFLGKFSTSARTRPYGEQRLGPDFYCREHTKPSFTDHKILAVHNLHKYMTINEFANIIKYREPHSLFDKLRISKRNNENCNHEN